MRGNCSLEVPDAGLMTHHHWQPYTSAAGRTPGWGDTASTTSTPHHWQLASAWPARSTPQLSHFPGGGSRMISSAANTTSTSWACPTNSSQKTTVASPHTLSQSCQAGQPDMVPEPHACHVDATTIHTIAGHACMGALNGQSMHAATAPTCSPTNAQHTSLAQPPTAQAHTAV